MAINVRVMAKSEKRYLGLRVTTCLSWYNRNFHRDFCTANEAAFKWYSGKKSPHIYKINILYMWGARSIVSILTDTQFQQQIEKILNLNYHTNNLKTIIKGAENYELSNASQ